MRRARLSRFVLVATLSSVVGVVAAAAAMPPEAIAQTKTKRDERLSPEESRAQQFQRVEGPQTEQVPAGPLLVGAYGVLWLLLMGYLLMVGLKQSQVRKEIARLEKQLASRELPPDKPGSKKT